jgi:hypothetical protein
VVILPFEPTRRMRSFPVSAIYRLPDASTATPLGK